MPHVQDADELVTETKRRLSELAFVHKATWFLKQCVVPAVSRWVLDSSDRLFGADPAIAACFTKFKACLSSWNPDEGKIGHYFNNVAVVYAVAILEDFLPKIYDATMGTACREKFGSSLSSQIRAIAGDKEVPGLPKTVNGFNKKKETKYVLFLARLRNVIVHNDGVPDNDFWNGRGNHATKLEELWDPRICSYAEFERKVKEHSQVWLNIDHVIIPYLSHAVDFVDEAKRSLEKI